MLWTVETDADIRAAENATSHHGWFQGGRLGSVATMGHSTALATVATLHEHGHKAWMSPATGANAQGSAVAGLEGYAQAREGVVEAIHAGLEIGMKKTEMARLSGLSRPGLDKIIDRFGLDALVKGDAPT